jgi:hypothetical protein
MMMRTRHDTRWELAAPRPRRRFGFQIPSIRFFCNGAHATKIEPNMLETTSRTIRIGSIQIRCDRTVDEGRDLDSK